jgi:hypothetical protein
MKMKADPNASIEEMLQEFWKCMTAHGVSI